MGLHGGALYYYIISPEKFEIGLRDLRSDDKDITELYDLIKIEDEVVDDWDRKRSMWELVRK